MRLIDEVQRLKKQLAQGHSARIGGSKKLDSGLGDLKTCVSSCLSCSRPAALTRAHQLSFSLGSIFSLRSHPCQIKSFCTSWFPFSSPCWFTSRSLTTIPPHFAHLDRGSLTTLTLSWLLSTHSEKEAQLGLNKAGSDNHTTPQMRKQRPREAV